jgi:hypothetical protein
MTLDRRNEALHRYNEPMERFNEPLYQYNATLDRRSKEEDGIFRRIRELEVRSLLPLQTPRMVHLGSLYSGAAEASRLGRRREPP